MSSDYNFRNIEFYVIKFLDKKSPPLGVSKTKNILEMPETTASFLDRLSILI